MNREIKFRGKSLVTNEWIHGSIINVDNERCIVGYDEIELDGHHVVYSSDRPVFTKQETICQFIGLYDKDDREVYEHDYVSINYKYDRQTLNGVIPDQDCFCEGEIVYMEGLACFGIRLYKAEYPMIEELNSNHYITLPLINFSLECEDIEVFGNIFDNPNLINK